MVFHYYCDILGTESQSSSSTKTQDTNIMREQSWGRPWSFSSTKGETNINSHLDPMQAPSQLKGALREPLPENGLILATALDRTH